MVSRLQKQLIIGGVYLLIFVLIGFWVYSANFAPSCHDGKQNGQEQGIDCGVAACGVACPVPVQALQIQSVQLVKTPAGDFDAAAQIYNPNINYGVMAGTYDLIFKDATGVQLGQKASNSFYMLPGETKYVVLTALTDVPAGAIPSVVVKSVQWEQTTGTVSTPVTVLTQTLIPGPKTTFAATIANNSDFDFDNVDVGVIVFDSSSTTLITTNTTNLQTFLNHTQRGINVSWPFPLPADAKIFIQASTNVFNNANFLKTHGTQEQFQQYF